MVAFLHFMMTFIRWCVCCVREWVCVLEDSLQESGLSSTVWALGSN